jgi:DNA end-binding protein Ku
MIRPGKHGLILHTMYYADEVRAMDEFRSDTSIVKDKELEMAMMLVETLAAPFEPAKYRDEFREKLRGLIDAKIKGEQVVETPAPAAPAPVIDIMEALRNSLAKIKKPPVTEIAPLPAAGPQPAEAAAPKRKRKASGG